MIYCNLVYTTQVNSTFRVYWLANSEVISQAPFTFEQPKKNKMAFVGILSQIKLLFGPLVIQQLLFNFHRVHCTNSDFLIGWFVPCDTGFWRNNLLEVIIPVV